MHSINLVLRGALELVLSPFSRCHSLVALSVVALIVSAAILLVVRATSDQRSLVAQRRRMQAALYEMRLFNDDVRAMFRAAGEIVRATLAYLRLTAIPVLWLTIPLALLFIHLQFYYGYDGLAVDGNAVVKVRLDRDAPLSGPGDAPNITLEVPPGLLVETPLVWIPSEREAAWRIATQRPGDYELIVTLDGEAWTKQVRVSHAPGWRAPDRLRQGLLNEVLAPAEAPIASTARISSIHVTYDRREVSVLGWRTHWTIPFLVISAGFTLALSRRFRIAL